MTDDVCYQCGRPYRELPPFGIACAYDHAKVIHAKLERLRGEIFQLKCAMTASPHMAEVLRQMPNALRVHTAELERLQAVERKHKQSCGYIEADRDNYREECNQLRAALAEVLDFLDSHYDYEDNWSTELAETHRARHAELRKLVDGK